ncbi:MAG: hypothetical protein AAGF95_09115 [Chloroflexota bacterium]
MSVLAIILLFTNICLIIILIKQDYSVWRSEHTNPAYQRARGFAYIATIGMLVVAIITAGIDSWVNPLIGLNTVDPANVTIVHNVGLFLWLLWGFFVVLTFGTWVYAFMQCGGRAYSYYEQEVADGVDRG